MPHFVPNPDSTSIPYFPVNDWSFSHKFGDTQLTVCCSEDTCPHVVETFVNFLRGAGFSDETIRNSMEEIMAEYFAK